MSQLLDSEARRLSLHELRSLRPGDHVYTRCDVGGNKNFDKLMEVRISGMPKLWKREPDRVSVPFKYGFYENGYLTPSEPVFVHKDTPRKMPEGLDTAGAAKHRLEMEIHDTKNILSHLKGEFQMKYEAALKKARLHTLAAQGKAPQQKVDKIKSKLKVEMEARAKGLDKTLESLEHQLKQTAGYKGLRVSVKAGKPERVTAGYKPRRAHVARLSLRAPTLITGCGTRVRMRKGSILRRR